MVVQAKFQRLIDSTLIDVIGQKTKGLLFMGFIVIILIICLALNGTEMQPIITGN